MSETQAERKLAEYDEERRTKIMAELESLKPWRYTQYMDVILSMAVIGFISFFVEEGSFLLDSKFLLLLIAFSVVRSDFGSINRIHKRIDTLIKLYEHEPLINTKKS